MGDMQSSNRMWVCIIDRGNSRPTTGLRPSRSILILDEPNAPERINNPDDKFVFSVKFIAFHQLTAGVKHNFKYILSLERTDQKLNLNPLSNPSTPMFLQTLIPSSRKSIKLSAINGLLVVLSKKSSNSISILIPLKNTESLKWKK